MRALLVIDVQNGFVKMGEFNQEINNIEKLIQLFKRKQEPILFVQHMDEGESPIQWGTEGAKIDKRLEQYRTQDVIIKKTPSAFYQSSLDQKLKELGVTGVVITGFNAEYCCVFNSITAYDRGYEVTLVEDAIATVNSSEDYGLPGFSIKEFIAIICENSGVIDVVDTEDII